MNLKKENLEANRKRILFASKDLSVGGMEKALVSLLSAIDKDLYDVTLVLEKAEGPLLPQLDKKVKVIEYKVSDFIIPPVRKAINLMRRTLFKFKHGGKYDFSCCYATYSIPCEKIAKIASENCALYVHSDYVGMYSGNHKKAKEFYDSVGIAGYKKVIFVSESGRSGAAEIYPELEGRFVTLGNLVDEKNILRLSEEKADIPDSGENKIFVFVGRLDDTSKKLRRLLKAFSIVSAERGDVELWIIGNGLDGEMYRQYADELGITSVVRFMGETTNPYPYIKCADCLVLSSDYEGFPVVYAEASTLGRSIITTVCASDGFLAVDEANAYVSEKNPESLAVEMKKFLDDEIKKTVCFDLSQTNEGKLREIYKLIAGE